MRTAGEVKGDAGAVCGEFVEDGEPVGLGLVPLATGGGGAELEAGVEEEVVAWKSDRGLRSSNEISLRSRT